MPLVIRVAHRPATCAVVVSGDHYSSACRTGVSRRRYSPGSPSSPAVTTTWPGSSCHSSRPAAGISLTRRLNGFARRPQARSKSAKSLVSSTPRPGSVITAMCSRLRSSLHRTAARKWRLTSACSCGAASSESKPGGPHHEVVTSGQGAYGSTAIAWSHHASQCRAAAGDPPPPVLGTAGAAAGSQVCVELKAATSRMNKPRARFCGSSMLIRNSLDLLGACRPPRCQEGLHPRTGRAADATANPGPAPTPLRGRPTGTPLERCGIGCPSLPQIDR